MLKRSSIRIKLSFIIIFLAIAHITKAQDIHFSQYYSSPLTLNPANTGAFDGDWRLMNSFRSQWKSVGIPYETNALAFDKHFYVFSEQLSAGLTYIYDKSGSLNLTANKIYFSAAYSKQIDFHNLYFGVQTGYVFKSYNTDEMTFPSQFSWASGTYDPNLYNNEDDLKNSLSYFDLNLGLKWDKKFNRIHPKAGIAFFHINVPNESFSENIKNRLPVRTVFHASANVLIQNDIYIEPNLLYMIHKNAYNFTPGVNVGVKSQRNDKNIKSIFGGVYYRGGFKQADAIIAVTGINYKQLNVGLSYDVNISKLQIITNGKRAFEISLIYTGLSTVPKKVLIPCDIY